MTHQKIDQIESNQSGFLIHIRSNSTRLIATDEVVQAALLAAFSVNADLELDVFEGTNLVKRVNPFILNKAARKNQVSRVATQIDMGAGASFLEIFVIQDDNTETTFTVRQQVLQRICLTAALAKVGVQLKLQGTEVTGALLPPPAGDDIVQTQPQMISSLG
jgi:hypothetical protein